jgi:hypothetical protein
VLLFFNVTQMKSEEGNIKSIIIWFSKLIIIWFSNRLSYDFQIDYHMIFKSIIIWFSNRLSYDFQIDYHMIFKSIIIWFSNQLSYDFQIDYHMIFKMNIIWLLNRFSYDNLFRFRPSFECIRVRLAVRKGLRFGFLTIQRCFLKILTGKRRENALQ